MTPALELVIKERMEQIEKHGFDKNHDNRHMDNALLCASVHCLFSMPCGLLVHHEPDRSMQVVHFPWDRLEDNGLEEKFKAKNRIDQLTIGLALGVAELDRLLRKEKSDSYVFNSADNNN